MNNYRYTLEKYAGKSSRYTCPACGKAHRFTRYIDTETGEYLADDVGRCNREVKCGYHKKPKEHFSNKSEVASRKLEHRKPSVVSKSYTAGVQPVARHQQLSTNNFHLSTDLTATMQGYEQNHLVQYLINTLGAEAVIKLLEQYRVGTHHHWQGSTVFWYVSHRQHICSGKVMLYDSHTGKRVKHPFPHITWMHSLLDKEDFVKQPCLFGEHLLVDTTLPVCLVESEKTALIAAHYLGDSIWLATGGIGNLDVAYCKHVLNGRKVTLFPDAGGYMKWKAIQERLPGSNITPLIEHFGDGDGDDIADLLLCA